MKKTLSPSKKTIGIIITTIMISLSLAPAVFAVECDQDKDGYVSLTQNMMEVLVADNAYESNGNYSPEEWSGIFENYKANVASDEGITKDYICDSLNFKKGAEPTRCDQPTLSASSGVYDTAKVTSLTGNKVNPGTFDAPDNGIDENCDGVDGKLLMNASGGKDLSGLADRAITLLGRAVAVISIIILIWGGILYATATGDEQKTSKARKAIIGAIIGLIVGLLAPSIVNAIIAGLG
ncbi:hypothetical protein COY07_03665 [Candidatus Peregrinibacteria bacterium CG_4_10_14_0_2_um_filter_43_11]|nr:MAG: hypothetical protein COY07_03665 [Candidatus Peregrinibacteria bacterium CG_4_10_14_0_2_um_filter_43_11]